MTKLSEMSKVPLGSLVSPVDNTPVWERRTKNPSQKTVGCMTNRDVAVVLDKKYDTGAGWVELKVLFEGRIGWVLQGHVRIVR